MKTAITQMMDQEDKYGGALVPPDEASKCLL